MTTRQPRTPHEAAMLDPLGLTALAPNRPRGLFGGVGRQRFMSQPSAATGYAAGQEASPPPISAAPTPLPDWQNIVGPELLANIQQNGANPTLGSQPSGATLGQGLPATVPPRGLIAPSGLRGGSIGKIGNHGATLGDAVLPTAQGKKGGFDWRFAAGILGDALGGLNGQAPIFAQNMWRLRQQKAEHDDRLAEMREQNRLKLSLPDYATINNRRVRIDPTTGQSDVLYTAPQDFEDYAAALGAEPGTEEYERLVQDYVLRGGGPTSTENYNVREDWRQKNREELEGIRQSNRIGLQTQRQAGQRALKATPTFRQANPAPRRSGGSGGTREGATATNTQTGAKVVYRGGKWVPLK